MSVGLFIAILVLITFAVLLNAIVTNRIQTNLVKQIGQLPLEMMPPPNPKDRIEPQPVEHFRTSPVGIPPSLGRD